MENRITALPRRRLLGCGAASLALTAAAWSQPAGPATAPPAKDASGGFAPLPAQIKVTPQNLTIKVMINEKGPYHFVVDTGADRSVLAQDIAEALHMPLGKSILVQGIIRAVPAQSVPVAQLRFGSFVRDNLQMPVLPRAMLQADGYLGLDAIGANRVVFDFKQRTLQVVPPIPSAFIVKGGTNESVIAAPGIEGHLRSTACRVDGVPTVAFVDSGAEVSVGNEALRTQLLQMGPAYAATREIELSGITGGMSRGHVLRVQNILLGNLEFSGCEIAVADVDVFRIWELTDKPALLIGLNFLREFETVSVDYTRKEFRLKLAAASPWVKRA